MRLIIQVDRVDDARLELERKGVKFEGATETVEGIGKFAGLDYCGVREAHTPSR